MADWPSDPEVILIVPPELLIAIPRLLLIVKPAVVCSVPPFIVIVFEAAELPRFADALTISVPPLIAVVPEYVFDPDSSCVPGPAMTTEGRRP